MYTQQKSELCKICAKSKATRAFDFTDIKC